MLSCVAEKRELNHKYQAIKKRLAGDTARALTAVEAGSVEIRRGQALVVVRFEAPDDQEASDVGRAVVRRIDELVVVESSRTTRRFGARWYPLR